MITREEADQLRDKLLAVLAEDAHNTERLLGRLDALTHESGVGAHAALLLILTHLAFSESDARAHWEEILAHREQLGQALGRDAGIRVAVLDYFMNVNRRLVQPTLIDLEMYESTERDALADRLTGLSTERAFRSAVQHELRRAKRYSQRAAVVLFDLDDFAEVNARCGALVADRLLREAAMLLSNKIRDIDVAARPGEDELALLLPETDRTGALLVADRFRREIESFFARRESGGRPVALTVSGGVASYPQDAANAEGLLERAAQALYRAKALGKNLVQHHEPERRRFLRFELEPGRFEVEVLQLQAAHGQPQNLSRNGILFTSPEPIDVGEEIEVRLVEGQPTAQGQPLRIRGRVVRLEELPVDPPASGTVAEERFEIGMAFDLDWVEGSDELLAFLERVQERRTPPA
ncbi:MAG TPA: diguanylate cyclase [Candidatus Polarisedimenticolaceae bacterium]|nr:diguanylate cyclase [Candidatus Polarisedimenticolaceae bacterium]